MSKRGRKVHLGWQGAALVAAAVVVTVFSVYVVARSTDPPPSNLPPLAASPSPSPTEAEPASIEPVRDLFDSGEPLTILVLGDSTSNDRTEWVDLWAQDLAETRAVELHMWNAAGQANWVPEPVVYGTGGAPLEVWNLSFAGAKADYPVKHVRPPGGPQDIDLVIYNYGHNNDTTDIEDALVDTRRAVAARWGRDHEELLILQNPARTQPRARNQGDMVFWLEGTIAPQMGIPTVNVYAAFRRADVPLRELLRDDLHPNEAGSLVWAETVSDALQG